MLANHRALGVRTNVTIGILQSQATTCAEVATISPPVADTSGTPKTASYVLTSALVFI